MESGEVEQACNPSTQKEARNDVFKATHIIKVIYTVFVLFSQADFTLTM